VQVEHAGVLADAGRREPFRPPFGRRHHLDLHVGRRREDPFGALVLRAALGDAERVRRRELGQVRADDVDALVTHGPYGTSPGAAALSC
jgi:hypothetical protein